ncbi:MAG: aminotransferase class V-fold PLP-dependent enzyme [Proteobacteria bacterium]|nr:aminotransferase class V-fold PLP-dependent enzyme [Pseudomonadota bacterium]
MPLQPRGRPLDDVLGQMRKEKEADADWRGGRTWSLVYPAGEEIDACLEAANRLYLYENALNPLRFPSLRRMERDVVETTCGLLHGAESASGAMTSGGTESILMAVKTARDRAREERGVRSPKLLAPYSAHPAFAKAAHYLGLELVQIPLDTDYRADVGAAREQIDEQTVLVVGSAPCYPFGVVDPIPELAALAAEHGTSFHTDACLGGFLLPFLERLGEPVPAFDFRVPGVTTISADIHKYGYCTKGASIIAHAHKDTLRRYQTFVYDRWPGGVYGSAAMAGARPAAPIAAAWAVLQFLGEEGYLAQARRIVATTRHLREGIESIPELRLHGDPVMSVLAFGSDEIDVFAVGDVLDEKGWCLDRQTQPDALHLMVSPEHDRVADALLDDLRHAVQHHGRARAHTARYS